MGFEAPRQLSPEEQERLKQEAKLTSGKLGHDVQAMGEGAEYVADEGGDSPRLEFTRDQLEAAREEMFGDIIQKKESKIEELEETGELLDITVLHMRKTLEETLFAIGMDRGQVEKIVQNTIDLGKEGFRATQENQKHPGERTRVRIDAEDKYKVLHEERERILQGIRGLGVKSRSTMESIMGN